MNKKEKAIKAGWGVFEWLRPFGPEVIIDNRNPVLRLMFCNQHDKELQRPLTHLFTFKRVCRILEVAKLVGELGVALPTINQGFDLSQTDIAKEEEWGKVILAIKSNIDPWEFPLSELTEGLDFSGWLSVAEVIEDWLFNRNEEKNNV